MIRTHTIPCDLPKAAADALNRASGAIYTRTLVTHYRVYRKRGHKSRCCWKLQQIKTAFGPNSSGASACLACTRTVAPPDRRPR